MTIAGVAAILFGFGYLMQISFQHLGIYSDVVKIGLGFVSALVAMGIGARLHFKNEKFREFGSSLIALGIILNYLMVYFLTSLSDFPVLSSGFLGFLLIVANTGISVYFAMKCETKVIAVLTLMGGSLTPFYLNSNGDSTYYFMYLCSGPF